MTPLEEVREIVLAQCARGPIVSLPVREARGCVLAADVVASEPVPPFANTAVDGYAVRSSDVATVPVDLRVIGDVAAGAVATVALTEGTAIRIMTGAPIPDGCDAVVMVEDTDRIGTDMVRIKKSVTPGDAIREQGSDVVAGTTVFTAGAVLTPMVEGVLASINARDVSVYWKPRVGVISTGDELVDDGSALKPGQIRESNRKMLVRIIEECGAEAIDLGILRDDEEELESVLVKVTSRGVVDALITSGGVSMGDYDVVKAVLGRIADMRWFQVAMKPAKPFAFGVMPGVDGRIIPVFGLPGNPVSSLMSFELIARPALRMMMGHPAPFRPVISAIVDEDVSRKPDGKIHFDRVYATWGADGRVHVKRTGAQGSHQLAATALANAIMVVPDGTGVHAGDTVEVTFLGPDSGAVAQ